MKCPKCHYVSHDYLDACRKCGIDLVMFKQDMGLLVLQPGVLDLSLVLGGVGADDLFASIDEEGPMYASDEDFDISLDDYTEHPAVRQAPPGGLHPGRPEPEIDLADRDRLPLELDAAGLPDAVTASRRAAQVSSNAPVAPARPPPTEPGTIPLPGQVTLDMEAESISMDFPPGLLGEIVSAGPPPANDASAAPEMQDTTVSLQLDRSRRDFGHLTSTATPAAESSDAARAENAAEPEPVVVDPTLPTMQLSYPAVDDNDMAEVADPALTTLDEPDLKDMRLLPSFQDEWAPLTVESMPEDMLTSSDIFPLEGLEETMPQEPLILELDASVWPGHLTLEDRSEMTSEVSSIILDSVPLATPSGAMPAPMPPGKDQAQDEVELVLDLDHLELDDDKPA
ncbi:MAG TPA: hypothetical protein VI542_06175 [Candidatus Tectomicrobia bacterium]